MIVKFRFIACKILKVFSIAFVLLLALCLNSNADEAGCPCESQDQNSGLLADNSVPNSSASSVASADSSSMMPLPKDLDPAVPIEARIDDLLTRMTLEEKVIQLSD
jgi:hypothetical protein